MNFIIVLLGSHFIADMPLQTNWMAEMKNKRWYILMAHAFINAFVLSMAMKYLGVYADWKFATILFTHMAIDYWKSSKPKDDAHWYLIYYDQALHNIINIVLAVA